MSNNSDMIKLLTLMEGQKFAGEPEQKVGDQVRGTDEATKNGKQHPFHNRLVGEEISLEDKLSKRYQDMKDVQAKEKAEKKKEESSEQDVAEGSDNPEKEIERLKLRQNAEHGGAALRRQTATQARIRELEKQIADKKSEVEEASLATMRDYYAGDTNARDKTRLSQMRDYFSKTDPRLSAQKLPTRAAYNPHGTKNVHVRTVHEQEPIIDDNDHNPVVSAISRRVMYQRVDLLRKYGIDKVMSAIDEVADFVGDVEEIGSSDVSGWIRHMERILGNMNGLDEADVPPVPGTAPAVTATGAVPPQNPADMQKQKNDQRKAIQDQIAATTKQLADLRTQLSSIQ
jgi:hypothetical protein